MATTISSTTSYTLGASEDNLVLTGTGYANGTGNTLGNTLTGNAVANTLKGLTGADMLYGGGGSDTLYAGDVNATGDAAADSLYGGTGDDALFADGGDQLYGEDGNDRLYANNTSGNTLYGGAGNDQYFVYDLNNTIVETYGQGVDTLQTTLSVNLAAGPQTPLMANALNISSEIEKVVLVGSTAANIDGSALANTLTGNAGANILKGMAGADTVNGGDGNDTLYAGASASDSGDAAIDMLYGGNGNDTLYADGSDQVYGDAGNDTLNAGSSNNNTLSGGAGDDIYIVNQINNFIVEQSNSGIDTVQSGAFSINLQGATLLANAMNITGEIENLLLTGTANFDGYGNNMTNIITGNSGDNVLQGGYGHDFIAGGAGNDTLYATAPGQAESMVGDHLSGDEGNDTYYLDGFDGTYEGYLLGNNNNSSNDTYIVDGLRNKIIDHNGVNNVVMSNASFSNQYLMVSGTSQVNPNWSIANSSIKTIELTGSQNTKVLGSYNAFILGSPAVETLLGNSGDNVLEGAGGDDVLDGRAGNDTLVMYVDTMISYASGQKYAVTTGKASWTGGDGQDTFWIGKAYLGDHSSGANQLTITDFTHGVDTLRLGISASSTAPVTLNTMTATASDTLATLLNKASLAGSAATPTLTQFEFAGNTYLVLDQNSAATFTASTDLAISLTGTPGLTLSDVVFAAV